MHGASITSRVQIASLDLTDGVENMSDTHPSLIEKPVLTVADLHLIGKLLILEQDKFTETEERRLDVLAAQFDDYLNKAVCSAWDVTEALV